MHDSREQCENVFDDFFVRLVKTSRQAKSDFVSGGPEVRILRRFGPNTKFWNFVRRKIGFLDEILSETHVFE